MTTAEQRIASIARQIVALAAMVMGALTAAVSGIHLPPAESAVLTAAGAGILWLEHYVSDPSTGSPTPTPPVAAPVPVPAPPAAAPAPAPPAAVAAPPVAA